MNAQRWKLVSIVSLVAFVTLLAYSTLQSKLGQSVAPDAVVTQVQKLNQLVTVRYRIQRVVSMTEEAQPVGAESILLMVEGDVEGGIDLSKVSAKDVAADDAGILTITLPPPVVLNAGLDEKKTKVWDRHVTWWTPWVPSDPELEHKARLKAIDEVRQAALDMGLMDQAKTNA
ncbi:MAG TPA: DUF4230 domain-containing protein, partial [Bryobacteraceae bacterium]|nr:DUF4230 domain-containing protein [Bryobacteraceae bacterium]